MPRIKILKTLLPNKLPTAISNATILKAARDTTNSGKDVAAAKNKVPKNELLKPVCAAICSPK